MEEGPGGNPGWFELLGPGNESQVNPWSAGSNLRGGKELQVRKKSPCQGKISARAQVARNF